MEYQGHASHYNYVIMVSKSIIIYGKCINISPPDFLFRVKICVDFRVSGLTSYDVE